MGALWSEYLRSCLTQTCQYFFMLIDNHVLLLATLCNFALVSKQPYFHFNGCYVNGERLLMHIWTVVGFSYRNFFASPQKSPWIFIAFYFHRVYCIYGPISHSLQIGLFIEWKHTDTHYSWYFFALLVTDIPRFLHFLIQCDL